MIAKDKKQAIIKEYGRSEGEKRSLEVQIKIYSKNQRTDRSLQKPERSTPRRGLCPRW